MIVLQSCHDDNVKQIHQEMQYEQCSIWTLRPSWPSWLSYHWSLPSYKEMLPGVYILPRERCKRKGEKKLTSVSFMYVCVDGNGEMLVFSPFFPQQ